ncbi:MAG TPA: hypothetical protein VHN99_01220 [Deinococcales bacterium]|nr:hypothetical protein [Deinococcales bacterium]
MKPLGEIREDPPERQFEALAEVLRFAYHATHRGDFDEARRVLHEAVRALNNPSSRGLSVDQDILETYLCWVEEAARDFHEGPFNLEPRPIRA